jgi:hypothetical protein
MRTQTSRVLSLGLVLAFAAGAQADVPWSNPNGTASFFDWANGHNATNLFGSPTLVGDTFYFFPANFVANSSGNGQVTATDTFSVDLLVHAGFKFDGISISELGDYAVQTAPGGSASVNATATLAVTDNLVPGRVFNDNLGFNPVFPQTAGSGPWQASVQRDLASAEGGVPFQSIHISLTNGLIAISTPGSSAVIRKTVVGVPVAVTILPEPGMLAMLGLGGLVAARRRRA